MLVASPFQKSPQLAAIASTFLAILLAIVALVLKGGPGLSPILTFFFPPMFYVFASLGIAGYEHFDRSPELGKADPRDGNNVGALMIVALVDIFLYPFLAYWLERARYNAKDPNAGWFKRRTELPQHPEGAAIAVRNLTKTFTTSAWFRRRKVTAIDNLSLTVPSTGIWILLGANGAGKSTVLSIFANLLGKDSGTVTFAGGATRPPRGTLGIVPQKNVLIPELSCYQTVRMWSAIKRPSGARETKADLMKLLDDCDLNSKITERANNLSGGQKRKLQLAIGLVGGSDST